MNITDYDHTKGAGIQLTNSDVVAAVRDGSLTFSGGAFTANNVSGTIAYTSGTNIVNFYNLQGEMQKVGYAGDGSALNVADKSDNFVLKSGGSSASLISGSGNDTAFGSAGDYFNLGAGENYIEINGTGGTTVELSAKSGSTTVKGFDVTQDYVKINADTANAYFTGNSLVFTDGNASLQIQDVSPKTQDTLGVSYVDTTIKSGSNDVIVSVAMENAAIKVTDDREAKAYIGQNSGVDLSEYGSDFDANVNLQAGAGKFNSDDVKFRGITSVKGGAGKHTLIGADSINNTLEAGKGEGTIWGGNSSDDLLIGCTDSSKTAATTFFFMNGSGNDTIANLNFTGNGNTPADMIDLSGFNLSSTSLSGDNVVVSSDEENSLTIKDARGKKFSVAGADVNKTPYYVKIDETSVEYDGTNKTCYIATGEKATLKVASGVTGTINLTANAMTNATLVGSFVGIDASSASDVTLWGNNNNNVIKSGSSGNNLLWGNGQYNDTLYGGGGNDTFWYGYGDGNDEIYDFDSGDVVNLFNISLDSIKTYIKSVDDNVITFKNDQTLTVNKKANFDDDVTFKLAGSGDDSGNDYTFTSLSNLLTSS